MKSPITDLRTLLLSDAPLVALLGGQKIYQHESPQGALRPFIILYEVSGQPLGQTLKATTDPWERRVSADCQGATPMIADGIAERVLAVLNNRQGVVGSLFLQHCRVVSDVALYEDTLRICKRVVDFRVIYHLA